MFSADISQVQFWEDNHYQRMTDGDGWDYLFPKFTHPSPWSHTNTSGKAVLMEDFVLIAEFSEQEGPRPVVNYLRNEEKFFLFHGGLKKT